MGFAACVPFFYSMTEFYIPGPTFDRLHEITDAADDTPYFETTQDVATQVALIVRNGLLRLHDAYDMVERIEDELYDEFN